VGCNLLPTMGTTTKKRSLQNLKIINHKCIESTQELKDGGHPTWWAM
jgi:hypothetical protein